MSTQLPTRTGSTGPIEAEPAASASERFGYGQGWLTGTMPMVMQEDDLLRRFVTIFEEIAASVRYGVDRCDIVADVAVAPAAMVRYLGAWLGAQGATPELDVAQQREIVRVTGTTLAWRGTARGVCELLEAITGGPVTVADAGTVGRGEHDHAGRPDPFVGATADRALVRPVVVELATSGHLRPDEVVAIVRDEVPAHLPLTVVIAGETVAGERLDPGNGPPAGLTDGLTDGRTAGPSDGEERA